MSDYTEVEKVVLALVGDPGKALYSSEDVAAGVLIGLGRYAKVVETVEYKILTLAENGLFGHSLSGLGAGLQEVVYAHWPAASSVAATVNANQVSDWWYYRGYLGDLYLDVQVDGATLPVAGDKLMVGCSMKPWIAGLSEYGVVGSVTSLPQVYFHIVAIGAAAYCLRAKEARLAADPAGIGTYASAYHVNVLAGLANDLLKDFDAELAKIQEKRLERPPWGSAERKRMRRVGEK